MKNNVIALKGVYLHKIMQITFIYSWDKFTHPFRLNSYHDMWQSMVTLTMTSGNLML